MRKSSDYQRCISCEDVFNYYIALRTLLRWCVYRNNNQICFEQVKITAVPFETVSTLSQQNIIEFLAFCDNELKNDVSSRSAKLSAIKEFYKYYTVTKPYITTPNPAINIPGPKKKQSVPKYLSDEEVQLLLNKGIAKESSYGNKTIPNPTVERDFCILVWFLNCGMRLSELRGINFPDIRKDDGLEILVLRGKGNKERTVILNDACINALKAYLNERAAYAKDYDKKAVFISPRTGKRLGDRAIQFIVDKALKEAGLDGRGYSTHKLRHTTATKLFQSGAADVLTLGHASPNSTQIYAHSSVNQIAEAMTHTQFYRNDG